MRVAKWIAIFVLVLLAIPVLAVLLVTVAANIDAGRRFIEQQTASLSGGIVRIEGLSGRFPDALRARQIQVSDAKGPYLTINGLVLDWSPLKLVRRIAQIDQLQADRLDFARLPESESQTSGGGSFNLPVQVDLRHLHVGRR
jgi:translocation and assembly module TamB